MVFIYTHMNDKANSLKKKHDAVRREAGGRGGLGGSASQALDGGGQTLGAAGTRKGQT